MEARDRLLIYFEKLEEEEKKGERKTIPKLPPAQIMVLFLIQATLSLYLIPNWAVQNG